MNMIASAVVVPEEAESEHQEQVPQRSNKRRQSSVSSQDSKRPRLSVDAGDSTNGQQKENPEEQRASRARKGQIEERKRGQRLFGALLGTLSQSSTSTSQKRREIEKRQQTKLRQQAEEVDEKKRERLAELTKQRVKEQKRFDEQSMRARHTNMLAMANFLQTRAEPRLYYKPWDLRHDEEDIIKQQLDDAEDTIDRELDDFERRRREEQGDDDEEMGEEPTERAETAKAQGAPQDASKSEQQDDAQPAQPMDITNTHDVATVADTGDVATDAKSPTNRAEAAPPEEEQESREEEDHDAADDNGEEVLEAEEDTVLY